MQASKVSEACLYATRGYGYNDVGRDTLEEIYAATFGMRMHWYVRRLPAEPMRLLWHFPEICRPGDELLSPVGKPYDTLRK